MTTQLTFAFHIAGQRFGIEAAFKPVRTGDYAAEKGTRTIDLQPVEPGALEFSISGVSSQSGSGQIIDSLRAAAEEHGARPAIELCDIWESWHCNNLRAGTRAQRAHLETLTTPAGANAFTFNCGALALAGLQPDANTLPGSPYNYGSAWLYEPLPADLPARVAALAEALNGARFGSIDLDDSEEINENSDTLDSRDIIARLDALTAWLEEHGIDLDSDPDEFAPDVEDVFYERKALAEFAAQGESYAGDWNHGEVLINATHFEDYAQQLAEDIGAVNKDATWPNNCIDWTQAAEELRGDYTAIEFKGSTFYVR